MRLFAIYDTKAICCGDGILVTIVDSRQRAETLINNQKEPSDFDIVECDLNGLTETASATWSEWKGLS